MNEESLYNILKVFVDNHVDFILGGRTGLKIQGVKIDFDDEIDICTDLSNLNLINNLLRDSCIEPPTDFVSENFKSRIAKYEKGAITIEVMANPLKRFSDGKWIGTPNEDIESFIFRSLNIKVFTLESEHNYYLNTSTEKPNRKDIAEAIKVKLMENQKLG